MGGNDKFFVADVAIVPVKNEKELMFLFVSGSFNRRVSSTAMNKVSSRSHSIIYIWVEQTENDPDLGPRTKESKIMLVDLAGSERLKQVSKADGGHRDHHETANINQSLF